MIDADREFVYVEDENRLEIKVYGLHLKLILVSVGLRLGERPKACQP